jgi:RIO-like serine/threonine protein kinase
MKYYREFDTTIEIEDGTKGRVQGFLELVDEEAKKILIMRSTIEDFSINNLMFKENFIHIDWDNAIPISEDDFNKYYQSKIIDTYTY